AVSPRGEYLGGAIFPGIEISLDALFGRAAALRRVELVEPKNVIGKSTVESIQSGAVYGFAAQVDGLVRRFVAELAESTVVSTGAMAGWRSTRCGTRPDRSSCSAEPNGRTSSTSSPSSRSATGSA